LWQSAALFLAGYTRPLSEGNARALQKVFKGAENLSLFCANFAEKKGEAKKFVHINRGNQGCERRESRQFLAAKKVNA